jgi:hypothetical protein
MHEDLVSTAVIFHNRLNSKLWRKGKLKPEVRYLLLKIARNFINFIDIKPLNLQDITISGSNAGYTYSRASDIDLHLIVDIDPERKEVYKQLFDAKKNLYNFTYDIQVKGIDVEVYVQDSEQPHTSAGIYSILDDRWLKTPQAVHDNLDRQLVGEKYKHFKGKIKLALKSKDINAVQNVYDDIRKMRQHGLSQTGELGVENVAFKVLRAKGLIEKLRNHISKLEAGGLSLEMNDENI